MKKLTTFLILVISTSTLFSQYHWKKHPDNPIMTGTGVPGDWNETWVEPGTILFYNDTFHNG